MNLREEVAPHNNISILPTVAQEIQRDKKASQRIKERQNTKIESSFAIDLFQLVKNRMSHQREIQGVLIEELAKIDQETANYVKQLHSYSQELSTIAIINDDKEFATILTTFLTKIFDFLESKHQAIISLILTNLKKSSFSKARKLVLDLNNLFLSKEQIWNDICDKYLVKIDINSEDIRSIINKLLIREILEMIDNNKDKISQSEVMAITASSIGEILESEFGPQVALDIIEGRYDLKDPYISGNLIVGYMPIQDKIRKIVKKRRIPTKQKIILLATTAMLAASMLKGDANNNDNVFINREFTTEVLTPTQTPSSLEINNVENETKRQESPSFLDKIKPENSENIAEHASVNWEIEGKVPDGNWQIASSSRFAHNTWHVDNLNYNPQIAKANFPQSRIESDSHIHSAFFLKEKGEKLQIPIPYNWQITYIQIGDSIPHQDQFSFYRLDDGAIVLINNQGLATAQPISIGFNLNRQSFEYYSQRSHPNLANQNRETINSNWLLGREINLSKEHQYFLDSIKNNNQMTDSQKAQAVTRYTKNHFVYSLNSKYSDYYLSSHNSGEYVRRALEIGYGDCDVVNTVNIAFLRYVGLDARMAFGYANNSSLLNSNRRSLETNEMHGWAQYFNQETQSWEDADATPSIVDDYSLEQLMILNNGAGIEDIINLQPLQQIWQDLRFIFKNIQEFSKSDIGLILQIFSSVGLYGLLHILTKKQIEQQSITQHRFIKNRHSSKWLNTDQRIEATILAMISVVLHEKTNYSRGYWKTNTHGIMELYDEKVPKMLDQIFIIIGLIKTFRDRRNLQHAQSILKRKEEIDFDLRTESVEDFLYRILGYDRQETLSSLSKKKQEALLSRINNQIYYMFESLLDNNLRDNLSWDINSLSKITSKKHESELNFIQEIVQWLYSQYIQAYDAHHHAIQNQNKKEKSFWFNTLIANNYSNTDHDDIAKSATGFENTRLIKASDRQIEIAEFMQIISFKMLPALIKYYKIIDKSS